MQARLEQMPQASRIRRQTVEHVFGTLKAWMGGDALHDKDVAADQYRDESACPGLQPETRDADLRGRAADAGDKGLNTLNFCPSAPYSDTAWRRSRVALRKPSTMPAVLSSSARPPASSLFTRPRSIAEIAGIGLPKPIAGRDALQAASNPASFDAFASNVAVARQPSVRW